MEFPRGIADDRFRAHRRRRPRCAAPAAAIRRATRREFFRLLRGDKETIEQRAIALRPAAVEYVADHCYGTPGAELLHDVFHGDDAAHAFALELGAEIPKRQRGVDFALQRLLGQKRRCAVGDLRLRFQIDARSPRQSPQQQPTLVERPAGDADLLADEVGDASDVRIRRRHHRAERARIRIEDEVVAQRTLAPDPQPVGDDQVGRSAFERDLAGLGAGKLGRLDREIMLPVEASGADDVELPGERSGLLRGDAQVLGRTGLRCCEHRRRDQQNQQPRERARSRSLGASTTLRLVRRAIDVGHRAARRLVRSVRKVRGRTARSSAKISISALRPRIYAADPTCQKCPPAGSTISYAYRTGVNREGRYRGATAARTTDAAAGHARPS